MTWAGNNMHLFNGCVWKSSFIQPETGTIPRGLARGEWILLRYRHICHIGNIFTEV